MTYVVGALYVVGAGMTISAALWAYRQAQRKGADLQAWRTYHYELSVALKDLDADLMGPLKPRGTTDPPPEGWDAYWGKRRAQGIARQADERTEIEQRARREHLPQHLRHIRTGPAPLGIITYGDMQRVDALMLQLVVLTEIESFRRQGLLAIVGIALSLVASLWALAL